MFGPASHLSSSFPVNDDGILNEVVNEERTQLERTVVEDGRVRRDPLRKLTEMKRKQREQRKNTARNTLRVCWSKIEGTAKKKHPEVIRDRNRRYRQKNCEKLPRLSGKVSRVTP